MDLLNLLNDLRQRAFVSARECSIKRGPAAAMADPSGSMAAPGMSADCTLNWLTLSLPASPVPPPPPTAPTASTPARGAP
jgi:hypothetical protein